MNSSAEVIVKYYDSILKRRMLEHAMRRISYYDELITKLIQNNEFDIYERNEIHYEKLNKKECHIYSQQLNKIAKSCSKYKDIKFSTHRANDVCFIDASTTIPDV